MQPNSRHPLDLQLNGYRLATAEILYHLPDHPGILQSLLWQHYDIAPHYPELKRFLAYWRRNIEGRLHSVRVGRTPLLGPSRYRNCAGVFRLH
ncbi:usg protein [Marinimicrococcus flavescens]|uniref:Usg family protein n=1 Tax=Marinimicrococcus flavescens TaxID=3031815 RepID=A0AAP3V1P9_9PROT|nr:Usg family protein [Marinimicrococcus flavescens]